MSAWTGAGTSQTLHTSISCWTPTPLHLQVFCWVTVCLPAWLDATCLSCPCCTSKRLSRFRLSTLLSWLWTTCSLLPLTSPWIVRRQSCCVTKRSFSAQTRLPSCWKDVVLFGRIPSWTYPLLDVFLVWRIPSWTHPWFDASLVGRNQSWAVWYSQTTRLNQKRPTRPSVRRLAKPLHAHVH